MGLAYLIYREMNIDNTKTLKAFGMSYLIVMETELNTVLKRQNCSVVNMVKSEPYKYIHLPTRMC